jgi:hypothetical protein
VQLAVLLGLAALWVAVLLPDFLRRRSTRRTGDSISNFTHHLSVLERSNPLAGPRRSPRVGSPRIGRPVAPIRQSHSNVASIAPRIARPRNGAMGTAQRSPRPASAPAERGPVSAGAARGPVQSGRMTRSQAQQRRQDVIVALSAAVLLTLLATVAFGGAMLYVQLVVDVLLVAYLGLLLFAPRRSAKSASKVTYLTPAPARPVVPAHQRSTVAR